MNKPEALSSPDLSLTVQAPTPAWFNWALEQPLGSRRVDVEGCSIHYLRWHPTTEQPPSRGLLFVHGGGAHANWWRFIAPFFVANYRVAAIDLSGMGDSATREKYSAALRAKEIRAVLNDADLGERPFIVGHSFGGFMTIRFGVDFGDEIGGAIIADTPVRAPGDEPPGRAQRIFKHTRTYSSLDEGVGRFRLLPAQTCENDYLVKFIAMHSLKPHGDAWSWKFDPHAMGADRWAEPFHEHTRNMRCRRAYLHGQRSALVSREQAAYVSGLMGPDSPVIELPEAQHHMMLDQPIAFVAAIRSLLEAWRRAE